MGSFLISYLILREAAVAQQVKAAAFGEQKQDNTFM